MAIPYKLGWHTFKFEFGKSSFSAPLLLTDEQKELIEISQTLMRHCETLVSGGYRAEFDPDQLDQQ